MGAVHIESLIMLRLTELFLVGFLTTVSGQENGEFTRQECVHEMGNVGRMIHGMGDWISAYLVETYCPTLGDDFHGDCVNDLATYYPRLLEAIANHYFVDNGLHICQTMGVCGVRDNTWKTLSKWQSTPCTSSRTTVSPMTTDAPGL